MYQSLRTVRHTIDFGEPSGREDFYVYRRYTDLKPLGSGGYGFVVSAIDMQATEEAEHEVVIKKLPTIFKSPSLTKAGLREVKLLLFFLHDNILALRDIILPFAEDPDGTPYFDSQQLEYHGLYLVLEKMTCDLGHLIYSEMDLSLDIRRLLVYQILRGVKCIHSARVLHRDLKPQNILVNEECDVKICDFGLAREYESNGMTTFVATQFYRAPELLLAMSGAEEEEQDYNGRLVYSEAVDVWSIGCIMAELILRKPLFHCTSSAPAWQISTIFSLLGRPEITEDMSTQLKTFLSVFRDGPETGKSWDELLPKDQSDPEERDLISKMVLFDPAKRISVAEALAHPFLAELHDPDDEPDAAGQFSFSLDNCGEPYIDMLGHFAQMHPEARALQGWPKQELQRTLSSISSLSAPKTGELASPTSSFLHRAHSLRWGRWGSVRQQFAQANDASFRCLPTIANRSMFLRADRRLHSCGTEDSFGICVPEVGHTIRTHRSRGSVSDASDVSSLILSDHEFCPSPDPAGLGASGVSQESEWWVGLREMPAPDGDFVRNLMRFRHSPASSGAHTPQAQAHRRPSSVASEVCRIFTEGSPTSDDSTLRPPGMIVHFAVDMTASQCDTELSCQASAPSTAEGSPLGSPSSPMTKLHPLEAPPNHSCEPITELVITPATPSASQSHIHPPFDHASADPDVK